MLRIHEICLAVVLAGTMLAEPFPAYAQHLLVKTNGSEFVGLQISQTLFRACGDLDIPIDGGVISKTPRKCQPQQKKVTQAPLITHITIDEIDLDSRTFKAKEAEASVGAKTFYFPEVSETSNVWFKKIKTGDRLKIDAWMLTDDNKNKVLGVTNDVQFVAKQPVPPGPLDAHPN